MKEGRPNTIRISSNSAWATCHADFAPLDGAASRGSTLQVVARRKFKRVLWNSARARSRSTRRRFVVSAMGLQLQISELRHRILLGAPCTDNNPAAVRLNSLNAVSAPARNDPVSDHWSRITPL